jgi:calcineurin-like phosphoesterase family protein
MSNLFFISDTHFSHPLMVGLRGFSSVEAMDEHMVEAWNKKVRPQDHVYHLGDVAMKRQLLGIVRRLNGHKRLIFGNHDIFAYEEYAKAGFEKLMAYRVLDGIIFSHIPVYAGGLARFKVNVHGHLHENAVMSVEAAPDPRYLSVCVERRNYVPVSLEELKKELNQ